METLRPESQPINTFLQTESFRVMTASLQRTYDERKFKRMTKGAVTSSPERTGDVARLLARGKK